MIFYLYLIGTYEVIERLQIFLTISNKHIQDINKKFNGTLKHFYHIIFSNNQKKNKVYIFKDMLL